MSQTSNIHLIDNLPEAQIVAERSTYVNIQPITINRQTRMCIFQHPESTVLFEAFKTPNKARLEFGCGMKDHCWPRVKSPVIFRMLAIEVESKKRHELCFQVIDAHKQSDQRWFDFVVDLSKFSGKMIQISLQTSVPPGADASYCWAGWSDPTISSTEKSLFPKRASKKDESKHLLLISSDALRADHLACYGNKIIKTPNLDRLAKDGVLFSHARAATPTTLGSYASLLTGKHATRHNVVAEWGQLGNEFQTLPEMLAKHGYNTVVAVSEAELCESDLGFVNRFAQEIKCLSNPAQSGDITVRQFCHWLRQRPAGPFFAWLQFFDTHPPSTPPEPFSSMYYSAKPDDPAQTYQPERILQLRGMESVLELQPVPEQLRAGIFDRTLIERLRSTADAVSGKSKIHPDLAVHLLAIGRPVWRNLSREEFSSWLYAQIDLLEREEFSQELVQWIEAIIPPLKEIELDTTSWFNGVVDFRYPISQYMAEVSFMDHQLGHLIAVLEEEGIYDNTTIMFTSPHGELLGEFDICFHHHALAEEVLHVPAIMKPAKNTSFKGKRVEGVIDHVDIVPTILDALSLPVPQDLDGSSRWKQVMDGSPIPEHASFSVDYHKMMYAVACPPFVYLEAAATHHLSESWNFKKGDSRLYKIQTPSNYTDIKSAEPEIASKLKSRLHELLAVPASAPN